jgi:hypothetical protein
MYTTCLRALGSLADEDPDGVHIYHADEEGDPFAVDIAARLGAYVTGHDSDYVVLNAEGYKGYIPMDEMLWEWSVPPPSDSLETTSVQEDGWFEPVRKGKRKNTPLLDVSRRSGLGVLPVELDPSASDFPSDLSLSFTVYHPNRLASQLGLPPTLLPLLGALVGNDYTVPTTSTSRNFHHLFFDRHLTLPQRITHVAKILRDVTTPSATNARKQQKPVKGVIDIIEATVNKLLNRDLALIGSGERERIVDTVAEATLLYAIAPPEELHPSQFCPLHECDACPLVTILTDGTEEEDVMQAEIRRRFVAAYRNGQLSPRIVDVISTTSMWPRIFLESPDSEATARTIGRSIREWTYAVLDEAVGLPEPEMDADSVQADSDDELIDVVEESTDSDDGEETDKEPEPTMDPLMSALAPKLQRLLERRAFHSGVTSPTGITRPGSATGFSTTLSISQFSGLSTSLLRGRKIIKEHLRRGTRLAEEDVPVRSFAVLQDIHSWPPEWQGDRNATPDIPLVLRDEAERMQVFLRILGSDGVNLEDLPRDQLSSVLAVRYIIRQLSRRAREKPSSKDSEKERWTKSEARALLFGFDWGQGDANGTSVNDVHEDSGGSAIPDIAVENKNIQIVAQFFSALEAIDHLAQSLLLAGRVPNPIHRFSGRRCHAALTSTTPPILPLAMWDACIDGTENDFAPERGKKAKKEKKINTPPAMSKSSSFRSGSNVSQSTASMYSVLSGMTIS